MAQHEEDAMNLNQMLDDIAYRVATTGTALEAPQLELLAKAIGLHAPGVAAALVDWSGPEVARARAFGIASGTVVNELSDWEQAELITSLLGGARRTVAA
jgi:hypothetical protein